MVPDAARSDRRHCYQPDHAPLNPDGKQAVSLAAVGTLTVELSSSKLHLRKKL